MTIVGVLGATGFVGRHIVVALQRRGADVRAVAAPRITSSARDLVGLMQEIARPGAEVEVAWLRQQLAECDAVVNAAGLPTATRAGDDVFGANALLPGLVARAVPAGSRFVQVSSAAVQGRREVLDETTEVAPFSPYSAAKALGEALAASQHDRVVCFRPTSVQGPGRQVTRTLVRICASPAASVAGAGTDPTPQVLVENVGDAAAFLALTDEEPPAVVLQPAEGLTTAELVRLLGRREPHHMPLVVAQALVELAQLVGRWSGAAAGVARRLEMMWFGQGQVPGWLDQRWSAPAGRDRWRELA